MGCRVVRLRGHSHYSGQRGPKPTWRYQSVHFASAATSGVRAALSAPVLPDLQRGGHNAPNSTQLLRLHQQGRDILLEGGMPLLEGLSAHGYVQSVSSDSMVLGFKSPSGATNMVDIAVGKVRQNTMVWNGGRTTCGQSQPCVLLKRRESNVHSRPVCAKIRLLCTLFRLSILLRAYTLSHTETSMLDHVQDSLWHALLRFAPCWGFGNMAIP